MSKHGGLRGRKLRHLDLFSGIGGFALAAFWVWGRYHELVGFVENDLFCQAILRKHFPGVPIHGDISTFHWAKTFPAGIGGEGERAEQHSWAGVQLPHALRYSRSEGGIDLLTGGFPCQPASHAGQRRGTSDDRWLWPEMLRVIRETSPRWVVAENVPGLLSLERGVVFESVLSDLEACDYKIQTVTIPACAVGAPHKRDRVWIVAHSNHTGDRTSPGAIRCNGSASVEGREELALDQSGRPGTTHANSNSVRLQESGTEQQTGGTGQFHEASPNSLSVRRNISDISRRMERTKGNGQEEERSSHIIALEATHSNKSSSHSDDAGCSDRNGKPEGEQASTEEGFDSIGGRDPVQASSPDSSSLEGRTEQEVERGGETRAQIGIDRHESRWDEDWAEAAARLCTPNDGLPGGLARPRGWRNAALKAAGNSIVPEVAERIFRGVMAVDNERELAARRGPR